MLHSSLGVVWKQEGSGCTRHTRTGRTLGVPWRARAGWHGVPHERWHGVPHGVPRGARPGDDLSLVEGWPSAHAALAMACPRSSIARAAHILPRDTASLPLRQVVTAVPVQQPGRAAVHHDVRRRCIVQIPAVPSSGGGHSAADQAATMFIASILVQAQVARRPITRRRLETKHFAG